MSKFRCFDTYNLNNFSSSDYTKRRRRNTIFTEAQTIAIGNSSYQNGITSKFKPFVYTDCLKRVQNWEEPDIDVLFYGSLTESRLKILCDIAERTLYTPFMMLTHTDGEKLDEYIARSKIIIDLHTEGDDKIQKQSRIYYALINNKCVVSQKSKRNYFKDLIIEPEEDFCAGLLHTLESGNWKNYSQNTAEKFKLQSTNLIYNYDLFNS
jgi:hypothetical protein